MLPSSFADIISIIFSSTVQLQSNLVSVLQTVPVGNSIEKPTFNKELLFSP